MDIKHRMYVIDNLTMVNEVMDFEDDDMGSASNLLIKIRKKYQKIKLYLPTVVIAQIAQKF